MKWLDHHQYLREDAEEALIPNPHKNSAICGASAYAIIELLDERGPMLSCLKRLLDVARLVNDDDLNLSQSDSLRSLIKECDAVVDKAEGKDGS